MNSSLLPRDLSGRIPELDGLRGIAIGMVLLFHFGEPVVDRPGSALAYALVPGRLAWSGVDLFFVLSGFLIGGILLDAKQARNYFQVFYVRRFFRIVPTYAVALAFSILLVIAVANGRAQRLAFSVQGKTEIRDWIPYLFFLQNFWMAASSSLHALDLTWSLAVEEQFYLTLPLMIRFLSRRQLVRTILVVIVSAPLLRCGLIWIWPEHLLSRLVLMPCRADALMMGVLGAIALRDAGWNARITNSRGVMRVALLVLSAGCAVLTLRSPAPIDRGMQMVGYTWLAMFYACILVYALTNRSGWIAWLLRSRQLGWLGAIAYGVYLYHMDILLTVYAAIRGRRAIIAGFPDLCIFILALVITLVFCRLSWTYFEKPLVRLGHRAHYEFAGEPQTANGKLRLETASK